MCGCSQSGQLIVVWLVSRFKNNSWRNSLNVFFGVWNWDNPPSPPSSSSFDPNALDIHRLLLMVWVGAAHRTQFILAGSSSFPSPFVVVLLFSSPTKINRNQFLCFILSLTSLFLSSAALVLFFFFDWWTFFLLFKICEGRQHVFWIEMAGRPTGTKNYLQI